MKILKHSPTQLQKFLEQMVILGKKVFPTLDRTIVGDTVINLNQGKDHSTATSLWWDTIKFDEVQKTMSNNSMIDSKLESNIRQKAICVKMRAI